MGLFGYKESKVEDGLRRSTRAVLIGGLFHQDHAEKFKLNKEATAWLYTEMLAQLIYCIGIVFNHKICGKKSWATPEFMENCIKKEIEIYEKEINQHPGSIMSFIFKRLYEIENMSPQERANLEHIKESAKRIKKIDPKTNITSLEEIFAIKTREFSQMLLERF